MLKIMTVVAALLICGSAAAQDRCYGPEDFECSGVYRDNVERFRGYVVEMRQNKWVYWSYVGTYRSREEADNVATMMEYRYPGAMTRVRPAQRGY